MPSYNKLSNRRLGLVATSGIGCGPFQWSGGGRNGMGAAEAFDLTKPTKRSFSFPINRAIFPAITSTRLLHRLGLFLFAAAMLGQPTFEGSVVGVSDGNTLTVLISQKTQVKVRLAGIDAPESGQPFGSRAKKELSGLLFGSRVKVEAGDRLRR